MASIVVAGDTSGTVTLTAPATAGTTTLTLPTTTGTVLASNSASTINSGTSSSMTLQTNGTTAMTIDTSQNVGIGTTSLTQKLSINSSGTSVNSLISFKQADTEYMQVGMGADNNAYLLTTSRPMLFYLNGAERMRIDSSGNLLVGTTSVGEKLTVAGNIGAFASGASTDNYITLQSTNSGSSPSGLVKIAANSEGSAGTNSAMLFYTRNSGGTIAEKMRIDSSGNVLVGTTSQVGSGLICAVGDAAVVNPITIKNTGSASASNRYFAYFINSSNAMAGGIAHTASTTTAYITSSDYRLKENIVPMTGALDTVAQLKPVTYTWKADNSAGQGFIAHELQAVVPDAVVGEKDAVDEEGNPVYQGVDTSFLVATLTAAIQEQQTIIETLKADIEDLKAKVK